MSDLTPRKENILKAVVLEHITIAEPVGSELIAQKYELGVRSATIRNELAEISDLGLLEQPHTSAGRIPSDKGYRYYVDRLIVIKEPKPEVQTKLTEATEEDTLQQLLLETTRALSRVTHLLSVAAVVKNTKVKVRTGILTALGPSRALLVLVLENGHIENKLIECPPGLTLQHIGAINETLERTLSNSTLAQLAKVKAPIFDDPTLNVACKLVFTSIRTCARDLMRGVVITEGEEYVLAQPEFQRNSIDLNQLLSALEDEDALHATVTGDGITIGKENPREDMQGLSILRKSFYVGTEEAGTLAIIGPTRLPYDKTLPLLGFTAKAVSSTLTKLMKP